MNDSDKKFMQMAIELAYEGMRNNEGGPFGAIIIKNHTIIGQGYNRVTSSNDPTAHAEIVAIRDACKNLGNFQLTDCILYTSCEPCPMCLGAVYWARLARIFYGCSHVDVANIDFDDDLIYKELTVPMTERKIPIIQLLREDALKTFLEWKSKQDKIKY